MPIVYNIYGNDGKGGAVDYTNPVAQTPGLQFDLGPLATPADFSFAVRACDLATQIEDANTDARVRVLLDDDGRDVTDRPDPPHSVCVRAAANGGCRLSWAHRQSVNRGIPTGFEVYIDHDEPGAVTTLVAAMPFTPGQVGYRCTLPGPYPYRAYSVSVRSLSEAGLEARSLTVTASFGNPPDLLVMDPVTVKLAAVVVQWPRTTDPPRTQ
jgi:hypothetical protein